MEYLNYNAVTRRQRLELWRVQLEDIRQDKIPVWRDCADLVRPRRARFLQSDSNKIKSMGNSRIVDITPTLAVRALQSGMMSGTTSPAKPWFRLTVPDPTTSELPGVRTWLYQVTERMISIFLKSNLYNCLPSMYGDAATFGTSCMSWEEDFDQVARGYVHPIGSYMISTNARGQVDGFFRKFRMTARQLVDKFGYSRGTGEVDWSKFSEAIQSAYKGGRIEQEFNICHAIMPNELYDPKRAQSKYKRYASVYYEQGLATDSGQNYLREDDLDRYLEEKGYDKFPVLGLRWETTGEDSYASDWPALVALGDIKQLMFGERMGAKAIEKSVDPPVNVPAGMRTSKVTLLPGDTNHTDMSNGQKGVTPVHEVKPNINELELKQQQVRERINDAFFKSLFLSITAIADRDRITATEIDERREEKLLMLGAVLEQLNQDLLDPLIELTFEYMERQGLLPPTPPELQGRELRVEYISTLAQAQKLVGIGNIERFTNFVMLLSERDPRILDKISTDELVDVYADTTGVPPQLVVADDVVAKIRQARDAQMAAQQAAETMATGAKAAKDASQATMEQDSILKRLSQAAQDAGLSPVNPT